MKLFELFATLGMDTSEFDAETKSAQTKTGNFVTGIKARTIAAGALLADFARGAMRSVASGIKNVVNTGIEFDKQMSRVRAISGATEDEFAILRQAAIDMGADSVFGATDAAQALEYMGMAGWKSEQMIAGLPGVIQLAAASGEGLGTVSDIVTDALTAFGLKASDAGRFADVLAAASSSANTNVGMMGQTFKYAAPLAGALGYSIEDMAVAIGLMANAGIKGDMAGTSLRGMLTNLAKPTEEVEGAMESLGISLLDAQGQVKPFDDLLQDLRKSFAGLTDAEKAEYAAKIAGRNAMSGMLAMVNASEEDYNKLTKAVNESAGATERMSAQMLDNLSGDIEEMHGALESASLVISDALNPSLRSVVQQLTGFIDKMTPAISRVLPKLMDGVAKILPHVMSAFEKTGAAFVSFGNKIKSVSNIVSMIWKSLHGDKLENRKIASVFRYLAKSFLEAFHPDNVAEVIGDFVEGIKTSLKERVSSIKESGVNFKDGFLSAFSGMGNRLEPYLRPFLVRWSEVLTDLIYGMPENFEAAKDAFIEAIQPVRDKIASKAKIAMTWLGEAYANSKRYLTDKLPTIKDTIVDSFFSTKDYITTKASQVMTWLGNAYRSDDTQEKLGDLSSVATKIWEKIKLAKDVLTEKAGEWLNALGEALSSGAAAEKVTEITGVVAAIAEKIVSNMGAWKTTAATLIGDLIAQLTDSGFLEATITGLGNIVVAIATGIGNAAENITTAAADIIGKLSEKFAESGFIEGLFTTAGDIISAIATALVNSAGNIATAATDIAISLLNGLTSLNWTEIFTTVGDVISAIAGVIADNATLIATAALDLALQLLQSLAELDWATISESLVTALMNLIGAIVEWFTNPDNLNSIIDAAIGIGKGILSGILSALEAGWQAVENWINTYVIEPLSTGFSTLWTNIENWAVNAWNNIKNAIDNAIAAVRTFLGLDQGPSTTYGGTVPTGYGRMMGGGRAVGLDYVPYNEFPARLHVGEAVLTATEAESWRRGENRASSGGVIGADLAAAVKSALSGMAVILDNNEVGRIQERTISGLQTDAILAGRFG